MSALADALNATFGLQLAAFAEARAWMLSPAGADAVGAWQRSGTTDIDTDDQEISE